MKLVNFYRKPISVFVMVTFTVLLCFLANQAPAAAPAPATENNSGTMLENGGNGNPDFIEQEREDVNTIKKSHRFPWLLVGAVVVVGAAAAYYFLVLNKKCTLTVNLGIGAIGTPAATTKYKKGETVAYNYLPQAGYGSLLVKLDGVAVAASGTLKMDKDHTLEVSATQEFTLTVSVGVGVTGIPVAGTTTYKNGTAVTYSYSLQGGYSNLSVTLDGVAVTAHGTVTMNANHTLAASAAKTFVLTVIRGEHITGTPASGTYNYTSGTNVHYSYSPASGYSNLEVKIDNVSAANAGTITMNTNHTLTSTVANPTGANLEIKSTPAGAKIYLDKVDSGQVTPYTFNFPTAVTKLVILRYSCGYEDYFQDNVSISVGQTKTINATLPLGIAERFTVPASSCWIPYYPTSWSMYIGAGGDNYRYTGTVPGWSTNVYNYSFSGNYTVMVRFNSKQNNASSNANAVILATGTDMTNVNGYLFGYTTNGEAWSYRLNGYNLITNAGSSVAMGGGAYGALVQGLNKWNYLRIVKSGSNYSFYATNIFLHSFNDATHNPTYLALVFLSNNHPIEVLVDYVYLHTGKSTGSVPAQPVKITPDMEIKNLQYKPFIGERKN